MYQELTLNERMKECVIYPLSHCSHQTVTLLIDRIMPSPRASQTVSSAHQDLSDKTASSPPEWGPFPCSLALFCPLGEGKRARKGQDGSGGSRKRRKTRKLRVAPKRDTFNTRAAWEWRFLFSIMNPPGDPLQLRVGNGMSSHSITINIHI